MVGLGSCGLDYLAQVAAFPQPDDKLRTERLEVQRLYSPLLTVLSNRNLVGVPALVAAYLHAGRLCMDFQEPGAHAKSSRTRPAWKPQQRPMRVER